MPAIPPEIVLLPPFAHFNIYEISCWSRAILVPLSIIYAFQPRRTPPPGVSLHRLFLKDKRRRPGFVPLSDLRLSWKSFFQRLGSGSANHGAKAIDSVAEQWP